MVSESQGVVDVQESVVIAEGRERPRRSVRQHGSHFLPAWMISEDQHQDQHWLEFGAILEWRSLLGVECSVQVSSKFAHENDVVLLGRLD